MSVKRCGNCGHPVYRHDPEDLELCRNVDCPCPGFLTVTKGENPAITAARLHDALQFDAIPTLLVFAEGNDGVRAVIAKLRAALATTPVPSVSDEGLRALLRDAISTAKAQGRESVFLRPKDADDILRALSSEPVR